MTRSVAFSLYRWSGVASTVSMMMSMVEWRGEKGSRRRKRDGLGEDGGIWRGSLLRSTHGLVEYGCDQGYLPVFVK